MNDNLTALACPNEQRFDNQAQISLAERVIEFYEEASADYEHWSKGFNMHLGFYRRGLNPFDREKMLEQLNLEIAARLRIDFKDTAFLVDLGCGAGAIARCVAKNYSGSIIKGVTIAPSQVETAVKLNASENLQKRIEIFRGDYINLPFADGAADGVWAVESACYAEGAGKENLVREMARVLKTDGRFVVADCFIKEPEKKFNFLVEKCYTTVCESWALSEMPALDYFVAALERQGFRDIIVEDISWRVAPSLCHAPFAVAGFIFKKLFSSEPLNRHSVDNLKASLLTLALGLNRTKFSYCLISGRRGSIN
ncbi:MAG: methyltransferase domain-containing protein [Pyrinomonadaceae bacterium]